jgi:drug/metabolite transporter (DMT)-like permease
MVATRLVVGEIGPGSLAMLRYLVAFLCLVPPLLMRPWVHIAPRDLLPIALLGIGQFGILVALLNYGLAFIPSARAALIFATFPLMTMGLGALLGRERLSMPKALGVVLTMAGVALALGEKALVRDEGAWIGELAVAASAFVGAVCSVLYRPYLARYPTLPVSALAMLASVGALALLAAHEEFFVSPPDLGLAGWATVLFIGVSSGIGFVCWLYALAHATPTRVTVFLALSPLTAVIFGPLLLGEVVSPAAIGGLAFVALGLWIAHR